MSATNSTLNYELPQFIATDKPAWLVDFNGAMSTIDTAIKEAKTAGDNAQATANTNAANIQTLDGTVTSQGTALGVLSGDVAGNTGSINTINSLIGNGQPTTTDKTLIGAINEINSKVGDVEAENVSFNNANTGLSATDVQAAIVEVKGLVATPDADDVAYDNTTSLLAATDVQGAIDEVNGKFGGSQIRYNSSTQSMQYSADGGANWANFNSALSIDEVESADQAASAYTLTMTYTFEHDHDEILLIGTGVFRCMNGSVSGATLTSYDLVLTPSTTGTGTFTNYHHTKHLLDTDLSLGNEHIFTGRDTFHIENVKAGDVFTLLFTASATNTAGGLQSPAIDCEYTIFTVN